MKHKKKTAIVTYVGYHCHQNKLNVREQGIDSLEKHTHHIYKGKHITHTQTSKERFSSLVTRERVRVATERERERERDTQKRK
jgi:hypothetical protein